LLEVSGRKTSLPNIQLKPTIHGLIDIISLN